MMIVDLTERVNEAKRLTEKWAEDAGYRPPVEAKASISKRAHALQRIMNVSDFGCQRRHVHAILQVLIGEEFPIALDRRTYEYTGHAPFVVGSILVHPDSKGTERAAVVCRIGTRKTAGLRKSNGEMFPSYAEQTSVRPATSDEIDAFFSERFGLSVNPADNMPDEDDEQIPF